MYHLILLTLCLSVFGASDARMPKDLSKMLGLEEESKDTQSATGDMNEDFKKEPEIFMGTGFDLDKYISRSPSRMASIEIARRKLDTGDVEMYMPAKITAVECHVEFQVTERVPGRCTRLAGSIPACQAEKYIGINYNECN